jgi:hypothetical protein
MMEKAMASGINASATTRPASVSARTLPSQSYKLKKAKQEHSQEHKKVIRKWKDY